MACTLEGMAISYFFLFLITSFLLFFLKQLNSRENSRVAKKKKGEYLNDIF